MRVFIAQVDIDFRRLDDPRGDQHPFEIGAGRFRGSGRRRAGIALVAIDRHHPRPLLGEDKAPFAPGREPGAAHPADFRFLHRLDHAFPRAGAGEAIRQKLVPAAGAVPVEPDIGRDFRVRVAVRRGLGDRVERRMLVQRVADRDDGGVVAPAHARCPHHPHIVAEPRRQIGEKPVRAEQFAGEAVAPARSIPAAAPPSSMVMSKWA